MDINQSSTDIASGYDELRIEVYGPRTKFLLLRQEGENKPFEKLAEVKDGWMPEFSKRFGTTSFNVCDLTEEFGNKVRNSTHYLIINSKNRAVNNMLYEKVEGTNPPLGLALFWRIMSRSIGKRIATPE